MDHAKRAAEAIALFNERQFEQALARIDEVLRDGGASVDLLNVAAASAYALNQLAQAEQYWRLALQRDPGHAATWNNLGILLQQCGRGAEAEHAYRQALALKPGFADAHYNLGLLHQQAGAIDAAAACYSRALEIRPGHADTHNNLGALHQLREQWPEALACFRQAAALKPDYAAARNNLALALQSLHHRADALHQQGRWAEAEACYRAALAARPDSAELHNNLAVLQNKLGQFDDAQRSYQRALALRPDYADALHNLAMLYTEQRRHGQAEQTLHDFLALRPDDPEGLNSLGNLYQHMHRFAAAEQLYGRALVLRPAHPKTLNNLAALLQQERRFDEAESAYRDAVAADPGYPEARWNLGFLLLARGRLAEGWPWMEARYDPRLARPIAARPALAFPQWQGESLVGKSIVVWPEQGFGDQIQFVRYLPFLKAAGARHVTLVCKDALAPLLRDAAGADQVLAERDVGRLQRHDAWVFMLSLPMHFGTTLDTIPAALPYLAADPARVLRWRDSLGPPGVRVGLVWQGFGGHVNDANRSLPGLSCLAPLWSVPGVSFVSLQRGMDGAASASPPPELSMLDLGERIGDFADSAAIVSQLDLVICVDTAVAHVAGALGKQCWVLLPAVHPDWRWMDDRADSPWYPGALKLYRQQQAGDWSGVIGRVAADLAAWMESR